MKITKKTGDNRRSSGGFTLIELLLYVAITGIMLSGISFFLSTLLESRIKNQTIAEVEQQGLQVMQIMTQVIRNAESITLPAQGTSATSTTINVVDVAKDPTLFDVSSSTLRTKEGAGAFVPLTNTHVAVSNLTFHNLSRGTTPGILRIQFTLTYVNPSGRNEYRYEKTFTGSAGLRHP